MPGHGLGEHRGLRQLQAHIEADDHQRRAEQERDPPAPLTELLLAEQHRQGQEQAVGGEEADRRAELGKHAEPGAFAGRRVLRGQQRGAAPFAAEAEALAEAQQAEQQRSPVADAVVAGEDADQGGGDPHQQQRGDQGRLAPDAVAEVAEQRRAQRTGEKGDAEGEEGAEHLRGAGCLREEYRADHQGGGGGVDVEIVELDGGADEAGDGDPGGRVGRFRSGGGGEGGGGHGGEVPGSQGRTECFRAAGWLCQRADAAARRPGGADEVGRAGRVSLRAVRRLDRRRWAGRAGGTGG